MGYKEEIFERLERTNFRTQDDIAIWLAGPKKSGNKTSKSSSYKNFAIQLQEPFAIREAAEKEDDYDKLRALKRQADSMEVSDNKTIQIVQNKMGKVAEEVTKLSEQRKEERLKEEQQERDRERLLRNREKYEQIRDKTEDRRKRENAKRNLDKIEDRLSDLE